MKNLVSLIAFAIILNACSNEVLETSKLSATSKIPINSKVNTPKTQKDFEKQIRQDDFSSVIWVMRDSRYDKVPEESSQMMKSILARNHISFYLNDEKSPKDWQAAHQIAMKLIAESKNEIYCNYISQYLSHYVLVNKKLLADQSSEAKDALKYYMSIMDKNDSVNAGLIYFLMKGLDNTVDEATMEAYKSNTLKRLDSYIPNFEKQVLLVQQQIEKYRKEKNSPNTSESTLISLHNILEEQKFYYSKMQEM